MSEKYGEDIIGKLTVRDFFEIIGVPLQNGIDPQKKIGTIRTHSEHTKQDDIIFVTYIGEEGKQCDEALAKGALIVFVKKQFKENYRDNPIVIGVDSPNELANRYLLYLFSLFPAKRIAITGSLGKTTTTEMLKCVISDAYCLHSHASMTNSRDGVFRTAQKLTHEHEVYLQEIGGASVGYIEKTASVFRPHACVVTNIAGSHLDLYHTVDNIFFDKTSLERHLTEDGVAFFDIDDKRLANATVSHRLISYALENEKADYRAENIKTEGNSKVFDVVCNDGVFSVKINILGDHNVRNALAAFAVGRWLDIPVKNIIASLEKYKPQGIRQNLFNVGGYWILLDSFNSDPVSVLASVKALGEITIPEGGRRIAIIGDIDRLGEKSSEIHRKLGEDIAKYKSCFDILYCFGEDAKYIYEGAKANGVDLCFYSSDRNEQVAWIEKNVTQNDVSLYKSGQFKAALSKTVDAVYGTDYQINAQRLLTAFYEQKNLKYKLIGDYLICTNSTTDEADVILSDKVDGYAMRQIGDNAFTKKKELKSIYIPDSVVNIGDGAFYLCPKLQQVHLPKNLKVIKNNAFNYCTSLNEIVLPPKTIHIGHRAFYDCKKLLQIYIPPSVGYIGEEAFGNCSELTIHGENGSYVEKYANDNNIPFIGQEKFKFELIDANLICMGGTIDEVDIVLPNAVNGHVIKEIGVNAFTKKRKLKSIFIPDSVVRIGDGAFYICPELETIHFSNNLKVIADSAFNYCIALNSVVLPSQTMLLGRRAFYDCKRLKTITIPSSVIYIGAEAFGNCSELTIHGESGSYAARYANEHNIPFHVNENDLTVNEYVMCAPPPPRQFYG